MATERWAVIAAYPDYEVSDHGRVRSLPRLRPHNRYPGRVMWWKGRILKPGKTTFGHLFVVLTGQVAVGVHRLVAEAFIGPPPFAGAIVRHKDDDPAHNVWTNLIWGTQQDNMDDAARNGRIPRGRQRPNAKLNAADIPYIRNSTDNLCVLARKFGVAPSTIRHVRIGRSWSHV